ncbi:MAG: transketolase [Actinobacteria bacterium]|nr:transketolase [Actinomycetota bacterium]
MTSQTSPELERLGIDVIRGLALDGPHRANSGHQGTAMALAPAAHVLWTRILSYDAAAPMWPNRDRFILSCGHASILQYSMLYLTGYGLELSDLESFRQWGSRTPGHPERGHTVGIEVTTGPLGQGFANGVGMAIAEQNLRSRFGPEVCDHHIHAFVSDGDLEEGISHEAASLAGHLGLGRLVYLYDDNHVSIDGPTELALSDDAAGRFRAYGWHVLELGEAGDDLDALEAAFRAAREVEDRPSLIIVRTHIATPSPDHTDDPAAHGLAFSAEDIARTKEVMGLPPDVEFFVPDEVLEMYRSAGRRGAVAREDWEQRSAPTIAARAAEWEASIGGIGLPGWDDALPTFTLEDSPATRQASQACITAMIGGVPGLLSGAADLIGNTGNKLPGRPVLSREVPEGELIHFGIREHAMGAILVGAADHGGVFPVAGTFLVFSDYMRGAVRLSALSQSKCVFVWSHDSVGVGEDGPTHQPIEHIMSLRLIPGLTVIRPADGNETAAAWRVAVNGEGPVAMILSRQGTPTLPTSAERAGEGVARGGYVVLDAEDPDVVIIGTGTEVAVALSASEMLDDNGIVARVVSLPSWELFDEQDDDYQQSVLPDEVPTVAVEAGTTLGWGEFADAAVGIDRFGASASGSTVMRELGITPENVVEVVEAVLDALNETSADPTT